MWLVIFYKQNIKATLYFPFNVLILLKRLLNLRFVTNNIFEQKGILLLDHYSFKTQKR